MSAATAIARHDCAPAIRAAAQALGRELSDIEVAEIQRAVRREHFRRQREVHGPGLRAGQAGAPPASLVQSMTRRIIPEFEHKKLLEKQRASLQATRRAENTRLVEGHPDGPSRGLLSLLIRDRADRGQVLSVEDRARGIARMAYARVVDTIEQLSPRFFGLLENKALPRALASELFGESTGNRAEYDAQISKAAKDGAHAIRQVFDELRERANAAGFDVGFLRNHAIPQSHNPEIVRLRGRDEWVEETLPKLDRTAYKHDDGSLMSLNQIREVLHASFETIISGGLNSIEPGLVRGPGMVANRHADHRVLHFKDAESWWTYHQKYAEKSILGILADRIDGFSRDIALTEVLGPNPVHEFRYWLDRLKVAGQPTFYLENVMATLTGEANRVAHQTLARQAQNVRNLQVAAKLGSAVISSVTDFAGALVTSQFNRLPFMRHARNIITALNPLVQADRQLAQRVGFGLDTMLGELNRFADDSLGGGWPRTLASAVLRASGLQAFSEAHRRAFSVTYMSTLGHLARTPWEALHAADRARFESYGFTADDWRLLGRVTVEDWGGGNRTMLTPESIRRAPEDATGAAGLEADRRRREVATKVMGMILSEESFAVVTPSVRERALMIGSLKKGTPAGELVRMLWLFKSFPVSVISKHWFRGLGRPTVGGKASYLASYLVATTVLGALAVELKDIAKGRKPREMDSTRFWLAAFAQGGGAGIFGDFALNDQSRFGNSFVETMAGPVGSTLQDVFNLTVGNVHQAARGEPTDVGAELVRFAKANTPGASLWYVRAPLDYLMLHELQEYLSPGYLRRMKQRARKEGVEFWLEPGR